MIIYLVLLLLVILTYLLSKKILVIAKAYDILENKHTELFNALKKREEYLLKTYEDDLELMSYYSTIHSNPNLDERIKEELALDSIDDEFDKLTIDFKEALDAYNHECDIFESIKNQYPKLYKLQNYIEYKKY